MTNLQHQEEDFQRFKDQPYYAFFNEQGTGKTKVAIDIVNHHRGRGVTAAMVITTTNLVGNWSNEELPKWDEFKAPHYIWKETKVLPQGPFLWFLINVDGVCSKAFPTVFAQFLALYPKFDLIVDESTVCKAPTAHRTVAVCAIARRATHRAVLTGTPIPQSPMDLWSQADILTPGLLGVDFKTFRKTYAILDLEKNRKTGRYYYVITGYKDLDKLTAKIQTFASIRKKIDCLDLPPKVYKRIMIPLTVEQKQAYTDFKIKAVAWIQGNEVTAVNAVALLNRLLQICAGQMKINGAYYAIPTHRLDTLQELIDETTSPTIVWSAYVNTLTDIHKRLGSQSIILPSGLNSTETQGILNQFRSGEKKVLITNPASFGHGITLVNSSNCIYYSSSFNYEHRAQSEDRIHRIGQYETCQYTDLVAKGTVEKSVLDNLQAKKEMSDRVITNKETLLEMLMEA